MPSSDEILLKLVIKGMDPDEVHRMGAETMAALVAEQQLTIEQLRALNRGANDATTADIAKQIDQEIAVRRVGLAAVSSIIQARVAEEDKAQAATDKAADAAEKAAAREAAAAQKTADAVAAARQKEFDDANRAADAWEANNTRMIASDQKAAAARAKAMEDAAERERNAWSRSLADTAHALDAVSGAWGIVESGFGRLKSASEEMITDTRIYDALTGSINQMRYASQGQVADIDLMSAKNRALEKDLHLTDQQFGFVAAAANKYADAVGINSKEALEKLIDGLATGRTKMLQHAGIIVDVAEANRKWAEEMGGTVDGMTDQDKLVALQTEALEKMKAKAIEMGDAGDTLADRMERGWVRMKNAITDTVVAIGHLQLPATAKEIVAAQDRADKAGKQGRLDAAGSTDANGDFSLSLGDAQAIGDPDYVPGIPENQAMRDAREKMKYGDKKGDAARAKAAKEKAEGTKQFDSFVDKLGAEQGPKDSSSLNPDDDLQSKASLFTETGGADGYVKAQDAANEADEKRLVTMEKVKGLTVDTAVAYQKLAASLGIEAESLDHDEKMQAINNEAMVQADLLAKKAKKEADTRRAELKTTKDKAGFMSIFLWGTAGPEQTYKEMDKFQQQMVDTMGQVSSTVTAGAEKLSSAVGQSIGAAIAGGAAGQKTIKQQTHDILLAMAEQAAGKAVWEGAEALADLAVGNFPGAGLHAAAAAAFAGVAVTAGLGARATAGSSAAAPGGTTKTTSGLSSSSAGSFGTGSKTDPANYNSQAAPVTINMTVMPGGEADAGRSVKRSLDALNAQNGQALLLSHA